MGEGEIEGILARAVSGDDTAVGEIVRRYEGPVKNAIRRRLGPEIRGRVDTEDIFQSAILAAVRDLPGFEYQGEEALVGWLTTIADWRVMKAVAHHRVAKRDPRRERPLEHAAERSSPITVPPVGAHRSEMSERIRAAVARLPEPDREVVTLRSFDGLTFREVAERTGLPDKDAARHVLQRALRQLGDLLA